MNQEKIIQAIAAYLEKLELSKDSRVVKSIAREIAAAIAPHLESGVGWEDAPDWAEWRTVDKNGQVTFWENHPHAHLLSKYWCDDSGGNRKYCEVDGWQYKIEQRPR